MNYLVATGGLSGFAVRMYFFTRLGISSQTAVIISLAQTFLTNCMLLIFLLSEAIFNAISDRTGKRPCLAVWFDLEGRGVSFMEHVPIWHYRSPNPEEYRQGPRRALERRRLETLRRYIL